MTIYGDTMRHHVPVEIRGQIRNLETFENLTFLSFPRKRESMKPLKGLDSRLRGNDNLDRIRRNSKVSSVPVSKEN
jgi:hypothetical protein